MPVIYTIDRPERVVYLSTVGDPSFDEWQEALLKVFADQAFETGFTACPVFPRTSSFRRFPWLLCCMAWPERSWSPPHLPLVRISRSARKGARGRPGRQAERRYCRL